MRSHEPVRIVACGVRCLVVLHGHDYEERITFWQTDDLKAARRQALAEARAYADVLDDAVALDFTQCYGMDELPDEDGAEVFSLIRQSDLPPSEYIKRHFDTGMEFIRREDAG